MMKRRNLSLGLVVSLVPGSLAVALIATPAAASDWSGYGFLENGATYTCAAEPSGYRALGDSVVFRDCDSINKSQWNYKTLYNTNDGYRVVQIRNKNSGWCLAPDSTKDGNWIKSDYCIHPTGGIPTNTKWKVWSVGNQGLTVFKNIWSHMCLGKTSKLSDGTHRMAQHSCDSTKSGQTWAGSYAAIGDS